MVRLVEMTYGLAMAAAQDAGNRSMRTGGRSKWTVKDWNVACETFERLWAAGASQRPARAENASARR